MRTTFTLLLLTSSLWIFGQISLDRQVIGSAGQSVSTAALSVDYTVGETVVTTATASTLLLTQGFHQPTDNLVDISPKNWNIQLQVYPNPTSGSVWLDVTSPISQAITLSVYNAKGQLVISTKTLEIQDSLHHALDFSALASGTYFIRIQDLHSTNNLSITVQKIQ